MFSPQNSIVAIFLLLGVMITWGIWPNFRRLCRSEAPVFAILYVGSQFTVVTLYCLTLGMIPGDNEMLNRETFVHELVNRSGRIEYVLLVIVGGFLNANGDFLCATALSKLPSSIANPIYGGWVLIQGTLLSFLVESYSGNIYLLFTGVFTTSLAIFSMTASDYYAADLNTITSSRVQSIESSKSVDRSGLLYQEILTDQEDPSEDEESKNLVSAKVVKKWIYVCILAGVICGSWAPLSIIARDSSGGVSNPYILMFFFQLGQVLSLPFMIAYYYLFFSPLRSIDSKNGDSFFISRFLDLLAAFRATPRRDRLFGSLAGVAVGTGFYCFFSAADVVSPTVSFALSNCAPLMTIICDVAFFQHLKHATKPQVFFLMLASALFSIAIVLMVLAERICSSFLSLIKRNYIRYTSDK